MKAISGSHALLTNIALAWNTARMHDVVERLRRDKIEVQDDWLRRIGPVHFVVRLPGERQDIIAILGGEFGSS